jgi:hypothetical protein
MKIKKPMTAKAPGAEGTGGAAIADRFKLENVTAKQNPNGTVGRKSAMFALVFGLAALAIIGTLTFTIYKHWEFLMRA